MKSNNLLRSFAALFLFLSFQAINAQYSNYVDPATRTLDIETAKVGSLPGSIEVGSLGSANYVIPLFIAPGTAGMQPSVSIVYNSRIDNGVMGKGFEIGGLSEIRRVPQDFYHENNVSGVSLKNTDKFALDSMRLILTSQGQYGADGTEYATEIESYSEIIAHGTTGTGDAAGPTWFEVKTKDGKTMEYGNTTDSRVILPNTSTVYMWRVSKIKDSNNNYIIYKYEQTSGESYIKEIKYTGNSTTGLLLYNKVRFSYKSSLRADQNQNFIGGSQEPITKLLDSIRVITYGDSLVRGYYFSYNDEFYSHLNQIKEYASDNSYRNATIFGWGATKSTITNTDTVFNNGIKDKFYFGDFNGDGRTDFVTTENKTAFGGTDKWKLYFANSDGRRFTFKNEGYLNSDFKEFIVADIDADGKDDIFWHSREPFYYQCNPYPCFGGEKGGSQTDSLKKGGVTPDNMQPPPIEDTCWNTCVYYNDKFLNYYCNGTTLARGNSSDDINFTNSPAGLTLRPVELDGDGRIEYMVLTSALNIYAIRGVFPYPIPDFNSPNSVNIINFDGDKKSEILVIKGSNSTIYQYDSQSEAFNTVYTSTSFPLSSDRIYPGDFNGDKKTDLLYWRSGSGWSLKYSSGTGFTTASNIPSLVNSDPGAATTDNNYYIADFNGDGKDDIAESNKSSSPSVLKLFFSRGTLFATAESNSFPKSTINQEYFLIGDFNGDGKRDIFYYDNSSTSTQAYIRFFHKDEIKHFVNFISNGYNENTGINYFRLNNGGTSYIKGAGATFPVKDYNGPFYAVSSTWNFNTSSDSTVNKYYYEKAKFHQQGRGFLGFMKFQSDYYKQLSYENKKFSYDPTYFYLRLDTGESKDMTYNKGTITKYTNQVYSYGNKRIHPYISQVKSLDEVYETWTITDLTYDSYGNALNSATVYKNLNLTTEIEKYLKNTYGSYGNWGIPNKVLNTTDSTIYTYVSDPSYVRKSSFQYDINGNLTIATTDPQKAKAVTKTSVYNNYGLITQETISAANLVSRVTQYEYDTKYRFVTKTTNPLGDFSTASYSSGTGNVLSVTDINNKRTTYLYDSFGNLIRVTDPLGIITTRSIYLDYAPVNNPVDYYITLHTPGKPDVTELYSGSGQTRNTVTTGIDGTIYEELTYNARGQIASKKGPHYMSDWTHAPSVTYSYDDYGRAYNIWENHRFTSFTYNGRTTTVHYPGGKTKEMTFNAVKDVIYIRENQDNNLVTNYTYASNGKVKQVTSAGTTVSVTYDEYGNDVSTTNPNSGTSTTEYNAFGQKIAYTDANAKSFNYVYDALGRIDHFTSPEGTTTYHYKNNPGGKEQIESIAGPGNISYSYSYDDYGRLSQYNVNVENGHQLSTSYTYGVHGNDSTITYPGRFKIKKSYQDGYLREILNSNGSRIWRLDNASKFGGPGKYLLGTNGLTTEFQYDRINGYLIKKTIGNREQTFTFDTVTGNLAFRGFRKGTSYRNETFTYDGLDRLVSATGVGRNPASFTYDSNGNMLTKTGIGTYYYNEDNAVDSIGNNPGSISNMTQLIDYTSFNKVRKITDMTIDSIPIGLEIAYGPDQQRVRNIFTQKDDTIKIKYYSPGYEKDSTTSVTRQIYYINCPYGLIAINIRQNGTDNIYYVDSDHLGSILALIRNDGTEAAEYSYDEWGRRRRPSNWNLYDSIPNLGFIYRGYTGHEHYDQFGLIDMNGRVYDPIIGRFLSPDPDIQSPDFTQSYNSYSYCYNNPLKYSDPTGYNAYDPWTDEDGKYHSMEEQFAQLFGEQNNDLHKAESGGNPKSGLVTVVYNGHTYKVPAEIASDPAKLAAYFANNQQVIDGSGNLISNPFYNILINKTISDAQNIIQGNTATLGIMTAVASLINEIAPVIVMGGIKFLGFFSFLTLQGDTRYTENPQMPFPQYTERGEQEIPNLIGPNNKNLFNTGGPNTPDWIKWIMLISGGAAAGKQIRDNWPIFVFSPIKQPAVPKIQSKPFYEWNN